MWTRGLLALTVLCGGLCLAQEQATVKPLAAYDANGAKGAVDPAECGWKKVASAGDKVSGKALTKDAGTLFNAWQIVDRDETRGVHLYYMQTLPAAVEEKAAREGYTCRWRVRLPEVTPVSRATSVEVCVNKVRTCLQMGRDEKGLIASLLIGGRFVTQTIPVDKPDDYHVWTMVYEGTEGQDGIKLYIDGKPAMGLQMRHRDVGDSVCFGSKSEGAATANWNFFEFYDRVLPVTETPAP